MEACIKACGKDAEYQNLLKQLASCNDASIESICDNMQALIKSCSLSDATLSGIRKHFDESAILVARSSANVEDLKGMSAAGLYESILGIRCGDDVALT